MWCAEDVGQSDKDEAFGQGQSQAVESVVDHCM